MTVFALFIWAYLKAGGGGGGGVLLNNIDIMRKTLSLTNNIVWR